MNQEQKQEALERLQESQRVLEAGISRIEEIQQLYSEEFGTRKNDEEHQKATLMPYTSEDLVGSLGTQSKSLTQYIDTLKQWDDSEAWKSVVWEQRSAIRGLLHDLNSTPQNHEVYIYNRRGQSLESWAEHLQIKIREYEGWCNDIAQSIETLSNSQDQS